MNARLDIRPIALAAILAVIPACATAARTPFDARVVLTATTVHAGDLVELRWNTLPPDVEELEILLSLDGGRHYAVRVTPECDPHAGRYLWRVPNLATSAAHLRLRLGVERRELEAEPGAPFEIVGDPEAPPEFDRFHENGWWGGLERSAARAPASLDSPGGAFEVASEDRATAPPPRDGVGLEAASYRGSVRIEPQAAAPPRPPRAIAAPRRLPLRL